jgi:SAM-dependent methyltransferase
MSAEPSPQIRVADPARRAEMRAALAEAGGAGAAAGWSALWQRDLHLWDLGGPTAVLADEVARPGAAAGGAALVGGCGAGYDLVTLARAGFARVVGVDVAEEACARARAALAAAGAPAGAEVLCADFFADARLVEGTFDFVFDYTFFCAIPPARRAAWGARTAALLRSGGRLLTLAFPLDTDAAAAAPDAAGPPFPVSLAAYRAALEPHGVRLVDGPRASAASVRAGEAVVWWEKA